MHEHTLLLIHGAADARMPNGVEQSAYCRRQLLSMTSFTAAAIGSQLEVDWHFNLRCTEHRSVVGYADLETRTYQIHSIVRRHVLISKIICVCRVNNMNLALNLNA